MKVEHYFNNTWNDISDYVEKIDSLPRAMRNRDYSLKGEIVSIDIAITIRDDANYNDTFVFASGDKFRLKDNNDTIIWNGQLESSHHNYFADLFELQIKPHLFKLQNQFVDYNTLHSLFVAGDADEYWIDHYNFKSVQLLYCLECLFTACGVTLTIPNEIYTTALFTRTTDGINWIETEITIADLYFDEYQLYCLNQSVTVLYTEIDNVANDYIGSKIKCWDLVSQILKATKLTLLPDGDDGYLLSFNTGNYTINDDDTFEYDLTAISDQIDQDGLGCRYMAPLTLSPLRLGRSGFYTTPKTLIATPGTVGKGGELTVLSNFAIIFSDAKNRVSGFNDDFEERIGYIYLSGDLIFSNNSPNATVNLIASEFAYKAMPHTYETRLTNYESIFNTIEDHKVDPVWENSEIVQEII